MHLPLLTPASLSLLFLGLVVAPPPPSPNSGSPQAITTPNHNAPSQPVPIRHIPGALNDRLLYPRCMGGKIADLETPLADCETLRGRVMADIKRLDLRSPGARSGRAMVELPRTWTSPRCEIRLGWSSSVPPYHSHVAHLSEGVVAWELSQLMKRCVKEEGHAASGVYLDVPNEEPYVPVAFVHIVADERDPELARLRSLQMPVGLPVEQQLAWHQQKEKSIETYKYYADRTKLYP